MRVLRGKLGTSTPDRMWLPHDLLPLGSPIFYVALVFIPIVIYLNEREQSQTARDNERLREERMRRFVRCGAVRCAQAVRIRVWAWCFPWVESWSCTRVVLATGNTESSNPVAES